jgi:hypothetical protein
VNAESEMLAGDLRYIIISQPSAQVSITYGGKVITGTKGNLVNGGDFDRDGGGIAMSTSLSATFLLGDFPNTPDGTEIVPVDGQELRIHRVHVDDLSVAVALDFSSITGN